MPQFAQEMTELRKAYEDYFAKAIIGLKNNGQQVASHDDQANIF